MSNDRRNLPPRRRADGQSRGETSPRTLAALGLAVVATIVMGVGYYVWRGTNEPPPYPRMKAAEPPVLADSVILGGSNTIGGHLAGPLLMAFAKADGASKVSMGAWKAPQSLVDQVAAHLTGEKLAKCHLNAKPAQQNQVRGVKGQLVALGFGSHCGPALVNEGFVNVAMMSRPINEEEKKKYAALGPWTDQGEAFGKPPLREHVIAMDGVVVIANKGFLPSKLSKADLQRIFSRQATNWREFGGPNKPIVLMSRDNVSGTYDTFRDLVMGGKDIAFVDKAPGGAQGFSDTDALVSAVKSTDGAIGFAGLEYGAENPDLVIPIDECGLSYLPVGAGSTWMIKTEDYPLARRLFLYTPQKVRDGSPRAQAFVDFVKSPLGQAAVEHAGFVSLEVDPVDSPHGVGELRRFSADLSALDSDLAQRYRTLTRNARQVTSTIRFGFNKGGEGDLDARARDDLLRVAAFMQQPQNRDLTLVVAGFADRLGAAEASNAKALQRAQAVAASLRSSGVRKVEAVGFGQEAPVGCNGKKDEVGRGKNRRVELWLRG